MGRRREFVPGPYKGLIPYTEQDFPFFFGRNQQRRTVAANLKSSPFTTLYGPSGVGKSSLLAAGVVHDLMESAKTSSQERGRIGHLPVLFGRWRGDPFSGLAAEILHRAHKLEVDGAIDPALPLSQLCMAWIRADQGRLLLILDQFEEFFLYHPELDEQLSFAGLLNALAERGARVLLSLREDQLALLERLRPAIPDVFANQLRVDHLNEQSAREAIEGPVGRWNELKGTDYSIEKGLTDRLLAELRPEQMKLRAAGIGIGSAVIPVGTLVQAPWLQIVMTRLWNEEVRSGASVLRLETLERLQGVIRIAERHLEDEMGGLSIRERMAAASMFPRLVTPSGTKVIYPEDDLIRTVRLFPSYAKPVLKDLSGEGRILERIESGGVPRYQIYHDQLGPAILGWRHRFIRNAGLGSAFVAFVVILFVFGFATIPRYLSAREQTREVTVAPQLWRRSAVRTSRRMSAARWRFMHGQVPRTTLF